MSCARTRRSVGPLRWTWQSTCSTACWSWDARTTSAWPNPGRVGVIAPASLIHATQPLAGDRVLTPDAHGRFRIGLHGIALRLGRGRDAGALLGWHIGLRTRKFQVRLVRLGLVVR